MSLNQALTNEVIHELENSRKVISAFKNEQLDYKPDEKSMSVKQLTSHVAELHHWIISVLTTNQLDFQTDYKPLNLGSIEEIVAHLEQSLEASKQALAAVTDAGWNDTWSLKSGAHVIMAASRYAMLRNIVLNHIIHHRGQLTVYLRLLHNYVPGVYGPSADDMIAMKQAQQQ